LPAGGTNLGRGRENLQHYNLRLSIEEVVACGHGAFEPVSQMESNVFPVERSSPYHLRGFLGYLLAMTIQAHNHQPELRDQQSWNAMCEQEWSVRFYM